MTKLHLIKCVGFNLGLVMRQILGSGKPRQAANVLQTVLLWLCTRIRPVPASLDGFLRRLIAGWMRAVEIFPSTLTQPKLARSSTGC